LRQNQAWRKETVLKDTKKLLEQLSKQCRNQEKRTNFHFTLPILPRQQKTWYRKIAQPKSLKPKLPKYVMSRALVLRKKDG
jgi:hypothetical protein